MIELGPALAGSARFLVLAVSMAVLAGLEHGEPPDSLRRLIDRTRSSPRHRIYIEFTTAPRLRPAPGRGRQPRGRDRGAAPQRAQRPGVRPREPGHAPVALGGRALAGRGRPPRRGSQPRGRRRHDGDFVVSPSRRKSTDSLEPCVARSAESMSEPTRGVAMSPGLPRCDRSSCARQLTIGAAGARAKRNLVSCPRAADLLMHVQPSPAFGIGRQI